MALFGIPSLIAGLILTLAGSGWFSGAHTAGLILFWASVIWIVLWILIVFVILWAEDNY